MADEKLDQKLRAFLDADARARANGITIEALYKVVLDMAADRMTDRKAAKVDRDAAAEDRRNVVALTEVVGRYTRRTHALERQLQVVSEQPAVPDWRPDPREITGTHELAEIRAAAVRAARVDDMVASTTWWRQNLGKGGIAIAVALTISAIGGCAGYAISRVSVTAPISTPTVRP